MGLEWDSAPARGRAASRLPEPTPPRASPTSGSYLTAWPAGVAQPTASNLNFGPGETVPNRVIVPVGTNGQVSIFNDLGSVDVIVDVDGYYTDDTAAAGAGVLFTPLSPPDRVLDTRTNGETLGPGGTLTISLAGTGAIPAVATALAENVTEADAKAASRRAFPCTQRDGAESSPARSQGAYAALDGP